LNMEQSPIKTDYADSASHNPPAVEQVNLLDLILILFKYKKLILLVTLAAALSSVIYSLSLPNIYTAKTMILPNDDDKGVMGAMMAQIGGLAGVAGDALGGKSKADLYTTMLKSETIKDTIIDRFNLMQRYKAKYRMIAYKRLDGNVRISTGKKDGVITIAVDDKDPKRAADIANTYVAELSSFVANLNMSGAGSNRSFLQKRIAETRADLTTAEDALKNFQATNKAISVTDQTKASIEGIAVLRAQIASSEVQLATIKLQFAESSHEIKSLRTTIANLRSQLTGLEGEGGSSSSIPNVGNIPALGQQYLRLMREFKVHEAVLEMLTKQYEMAKFTEAKDTSPVQIIQAAKAPELKSKPARSKIVVMSTMASFLIVCALSFLLDRYNVAAIMRNTTLRNLWSGIRK
jgi:tyrosine-protein kinase Etk/Wzc